MGNAPTPFGINDLYSVKYNGYNLLVNSDDIINKTKQKIALFSASKLINTWFKSLQIIRFSNQSISLEGLATSIQFIAADYIYPEFNVIVLINNALLTNHK